VGVAVASGVGVGLWVIVALGVVEKVVVGECVAVRLGVVAAVAVRVAEATRVGVWLESVAVGVTVWAMREVAEGVAVLLGVAVATLGVGEWLGTGDDGASVGVRVAVCDGGGFSEGEEVGLAVGSPAQEIALHSGAVECVSQAARSKAQPVYRAASDEKESGARHLCVALTPSR
jgi:hypothetical protein